MPDSIYAHDDSYAIAEAMLNFDEQFQKFRQQHILLIQRSIGMGAASRWRTAGAEAMAAFATASADRQHRQFERLSHVLGLDAGTLRLTVLEDEFR